MRQPADMQTESAAADIAAVLDSLIEALQEQLAKVQTGQLNSATELADTIEATVSRAAQMPPNKLALHSERIQIVKILWRQLNLALASQKDELAGARNKLREGKGMLKAYGWPGGQAESGSPGRIRDAVR